MFQKQPTHTITDYQPSIVGVIGELINARTTFDFVELGGSKALVIDVYGVGAEMLDAWAVRLKQQATEGAVYAYDHRVDNMVGDQLPDISLMLDGVKNLADLSELITAYSLSHDSQITPPQIKLALSNLRSNELDRLDKELSSSRLSRSAKLLNFAGAF